MQMQFQRQRRGTGFDQFLAHHRPDIVDAPDKLTRIIRWAALWDAPVDNHPHAVIRPDADRIDRLGEIIDYATDETMNQRTVAAACRRLGNDVNTKRRSVELSRSDIDAHPEGWRIKRRAERFGYA